MTLLTARRQKSVALPFVGAFDLFRIGIGPSSSHTVGPMRAAGDFLKWSASQLEIGDVDGVSCDLFGSLAMTGAGHATDTAVIAGLAGAVPETVEPNDIAAIVSDVMRRKSIRTRSGHQLAFDPTVDLVFRRGQFLPGHPNALEFRLKRGSQPVLSRIYYSIGGGFIRAEGAIDDRTVVDIEFPFKFRTADQLLAIADGARLTIAEVARRNEAAFRSASDIDAGLDHIWEAMQSCVERGLTSAAGVLPGGLRVRRRAPELYAALTERDFRDQSDPLRAMEWINVFALAVNEENAAGGRVVTAPTNGAAGIIPAVLHYYDRFVCRGERRGVHDFLLTAAALGAIIKNNASISGADVGCQGEVGSAAAMAAGGLAAALDGSNAQIENAAEIALEHSLGLTCDPVGGLVQVPCIERNAVASVKAINAARLALHGDGVHRVSLDQAIEAMRQTGRDMKRKYKETSLGGLAVNVPLC